MVTKPSIQFLNNDSDPQLIVDTRGILTGLTGNPHYLTPSPALAAVQAALDDFITALANAADGGQTLTAIKNAKRAALVALLRALASYVSVTCNGDLAVLLSSGFPIQKPQRSPVGELPAPANVTLSLGAHTGELDAAATPVVGASVYNWRLARADAPTVYVQTAQTTAASTSFESLTPGVAYVTQVNAVGSAGPSDWSQPAFQMAL
jgi:hypothetical protein